MHIALAGAASPTGIRLAAELLGRGHHLTLLTATDVRQSRLLLARQLALIGLYPEYVDLLSARLHARRGAEVLSGAAPASAASAARSGRFDAVWCVEQPAATAAALLPLASGGEGRTAFHLVTVGDAGPAGRTVAAAAVRDGFPAGVHCLAPTVSDLADHAELPRPAFTRLAVAESVRPAPAAPPSPEPGAPATVSLLPLAPAARALAEAAGEPGWSGLRRIGWVHAHPTEGTELTRAVGPELAPGLLRRLSELQPAAATTELDGPPLGAGYLTRAAAPVLPPVRRAARQPERV
ncbi:hypothetical protein OHA37_18310 [Streptomyces sp. NBC_00335]|uniref:hypothetical protein n=1 Tax=unclassified Streptomyces TaxID=2593676 RepID=UPI00225AE2E2|nr:MULTISPECIES: hypothetical protein [unclassified Streptomyces]MCX5405835.1 hypothetical protein [Streptomyces sp. NBC_00086]